MYFFLLVDQTLSQQLNVVLPPPFEMKEIPAGNIGEDDDEEQGKRKRNSNSGGGGGGGGDDEKKKSPRDCIAKNEDPDPDFALGEGEDWKAFIQKRAPARVQQASRERTQRT